MVFDDVVHLLVHQAGLVLEPLAEGRIDGSRDSGVDDGLDQRLWSVAFEAGPEVVDPHVGDLMHVSSLPPLHQPAVHHVATGCADHRCQTEGQEDHAGGETDPVVVDAGATHANGEGTTFIVPYLGHAGHHPAPPLAPAFIGQGIYLDGLTNVHEQHGDKDDQGDQH